MKKSSDTIGNRTRDLPACSALPQLTAPPRAPKADIVAVQKICWNGSGILEKRDCNLFYSCDNKDHIQGTGFLVSKRTKRLIIDFKSITPRICTLRIRGKFFNYSFVNGHAPTEISDDEEREGFFDAPNKSQQHKPKK